MLGGDEETVRNALSHAWIDGCSLRTYRHAPNTGSRKSWAAGDATSRAMRLALIAMTGEMGYPSALSAKTLLDMGVPRVSHIDTGFAGWEAGGLPVVTYDDFRGR